MYLKNDALLIFLYWFSRKFNMNLLIAAVIKVWESFYKFWNQMLRIAFTIVR